MTRKEKWDDEEWALEWCGLRLDPSGAEQVSEAQDDEGRGVGGAVAGLKRFLAFRSILLEKTTLYMIVL